MIKVKWHQDESVPNPKMLKEALTKAVRERIRKKFGLEYDPKNRPHPIDWLAKEAVENHEKGLTGCIGINHRCLIEINGELIELGSPVHRTLSESELFYAQLALPIFKWWSREHLKANRIRRQRRRAAKRERKHWRIVNDRRRVV